MRVLLVTHALDTTGATASLLDAATCLTAVGHRVAVLMGENLPAEKLGQLHGFTEAGIAVIHGFTLDQFDVLVANPLFSAEIILKVAGHLPIMGWIHEGMAGIRMILKQPDALKALHRTNGLVFQTRHGAELYHSLLVGYPVDQISAVPCAVPMPVPAAGPVASKPAGKIRIVYLGSVYPRKRPSDLVNAVKGLNNPAVECLFIGEPYTMAPEIETLMVQSPAMFQRTGRLSEADKEAVMRSADIFCLPSEDETFGISPLEAGHYGLAVLLSNLPCYEDMWVHGRNCLLHPVGDITLLNINLQALILAPELRATLGAEAQRLARKFTKKRFGALFEVAINDAMAAFRPPLGL